MKIAAPPPLRPTVGASAIDSAAATEPAKPDNTPAIAQRTVRILSLWQTSRNGTSTWHWHRLSGGDIFNGFPLFRNRFRLCCLRRKDSRDFLLGMPVKLSQAALCALIVESGLMGEDRLRKLRERFERESRVRHPENCLEFTEFLVRHNELTLWQAQKLVQGKHKGFLIGKYKLLSLLGRGGMSSVYLAEHTVMRRRCAIKILPFKQVRNAAALGRFYREAQAVAALDNPNIVRAYDVDRIVEGGTEIHFLVMEYVDGRSLQQVVDEDGPLPIADAVDYARQAANGLAHAHSVGVVHRDVKPSNLLLDESGTIKLLDLGLARIFADTSEQSSVTIEHQQTVLGTADYLSPEQAVDSHGVDHRSDIYSLGCTLYFLLTGHPPFPEGTLTQRLLAHQNKTPVPLLQSRPGVPASLVAVIDRMMAKQPEDRFQTADEVHKALAAWLRINAAEFPRSPAARRRAATAAPGKQPIRAPHSAIKTPSQSRKTPAQPGAPPSRSGETPDLEHRLSEFLRQLDSAMEHDTVTPSFPTSETIVTDARSLREPPATPKNTSVISEDRRARPPAPSSSNTKSAATVGKSARRPSVFQQVSHEAGAHRRSPWTLPSILGGLLIAVAITAGLVLWDRHGDPTPPVPAHASHTSREADVVAPPSGPEIDADEDVRVGPDGHFPTIGAALEYVRETFHPLHPRDVRRIRIDGGRTYTERIAIDNSQSRSFPQGVHVVCEDAEPAVLAPSGTGPVVDLRTAERFLLKGLTIRGTGQPVLVRLEGYLVSTTLQDLVIEGVEQTAIVGLGATGLTGGNRLSLRSITFREPSRGAVALRLESGPAPTRNVLIQSCRVLEGFDAAVQVVGGASGLQTSDCIFDSAATGIRLDATPDPWEEIVISNCTFRAFDRGVVFGRPPGPSDGPIRITRNLFAEGRGPECLVTGKPLPDQPPTISASFNFSQRPAAAEPNPGEIDLFRQGGGRGANLTFASVDPDQPKVYLQPLSAVLREAAAAVPQPPRYIGAVPPAVQ